MFNHNLYCFEKLKINKCSASKGFWYLKILNEEELFSYYKYVFNINPYFFEELTTNYVDAIKKELFYSGQHANNVFSSLGVMMTKLGIIEVNEFPSYLFALISSVIYDQLRHIRNGHIIYLNLIEKMSYTFDTVPHKYYTVVDSYYSNSLCLPIIERNIRVMKWEKGKHWYAKVGNEDVYDSYGNYKWNTKEQAIEAAKRFLKRRGIL